jgi:hypothetical protein
MTRGYFFAGEDMFSPLHPDWLQGPFSLLSTEYREGGGGIKLTTHLRSAEVINAQSSTSTRKHIFNV